MDLIRKVAVEQDAAIIAVTHDDKIFDRIFHLRDGRLDGEGRTREVHVREADAFDAVLQRGSL